MVDEEQKSKVLNPPVKEGPKLEELKTNKKLIEGETVNDRLKPVLSRVRARLKILEGLKAAKHEAIQRGSSKQIFTTVPVIHMIGPTPRIESNNLGTITYDVYKVDKEGNKMVHKSYAERDGKKVLISATPIVEKKVVETFEYNKPAYSEEFLEGV